ncbi:CD3337/EF1877 family mobilome membrane protein [Lentibacillus cibarius]|uniref:Uncharacterized protein n=1 Tax=Lentibacillus cibarius TaxID=2583219 RepID=A0A5S3QGG6_9BACI|nr:hypothetical protein [Lentibacillus cibarius]TMN20938.1 hypothetical protein FFL34_01550 [Lentibacillus cibarius]
MGGYMRLSIKRLMKLLSLTIVITLLIGGIGPVNAEQQGETQHNQLGSFKEDDNSYYHLDAVPEDFNKEESFADKVTDKFWFLDMKDKAGQKMNEFFNYLVNIAFDMNILMTNFMISSLDFAYSFDFINLIIEKLDSIMQKITGITGIGNFSSNGIFGNLAKFVALFTVIYAIFLMVWKRSMFSSLGTILQTVLALTIALLLFTNYSTFLSGLNQVTTEASTLVLAGNLNEQGQNGAQEVENAGPTNLDEESLKLEMKNNLWTLFVDRPFMYMMYGETNLNNLADSKDKAINRVNNLLKAKPNSEERYDAIATETKDWNNNNLFYDNISKRLSFTPMYLTINGITSLPVYFLALALLLFQFWFMLIAIFAPFALLFGAMPGQFNVVKRYFIELGLPLVLKIVVAFSALIIFAISELLYQADFTATQSGNPFMGYIAAALIHFVLFMLLFFLRKRIKNIFAAGSQGVQEIRDGMGDFNNPLKKGTQGLATTYGAAIGGLTTGGAGALAGANIGSSVGKMATGEGNVADVTKSGIQAKRSSQLTSLKQRNEINSEASVIPANQSSSVRPPDKDVHSSTVSEKSETSNTGNNKEMTEQENGRSDPMPSLQPDNNNVKANNKDTQGKNVEGDTLGTLSPGTVQSNTAANNVDRLSYGQPDNLSSGHITENNIATQSKSGKNTLGKDGPETVVKSPLKTPQYGELAEDRTNNVQMSEHDNSTDLASLENHMPPVANEKRTEQNDYPELD